MKYNIHIIIVAFLIGSTLPVSARESMIDTTPAISLFESVETIKSFLIEGAIQGVISGVLALLILLLVYSLFSLKKIYIFGLPVLSIVFLPSGYSIFIIILSLILGLLGGFIAVGRFFELY